VRPQRPDLIVAFDFGAARLLKGTEEGRELFSSLRSDRRDKCVR
jgi:hypothetical protein